MAWPYSPSFTRSMPTSRWRATTSAVASASLSAYSCSSTASPSARLWLRSRRSSGRGRLPAWLVNTRWDIFAPLAGSRGAIVPPLGGSRGEGAGGHLGHGAQHGGHGGREQHRGQHRTRAPREHQRRRAHPRQSRIGVHRVPVGDRLHHHQRSQQRRRQERHHTEESRRQMAPAEEQRGSALHDHVRSSKAPMATHASVIGAPLPRRPPAQPRAPARRGA